MTHTEEIIQVSRAKKNKLKALLRDRDLPLTVQEVLKIRRLLGRDPTLTELTIFSIQGSEHSSYKSSRKYLRLLPSKAPHVMLGPGEDSGIVEFAEVPKEKGRGKRKFGIVMAHESHNHPSQIVPYEGAATGVGGIVRDVVCMGAHVIAVADPLRFGDIKRNQSKYIAEEVVAGIGGYGNPIGVPNIAGDVYFDKSFNDNCLVNVVALGLVEEDEIIHSRAPEGALKAGGYDIIIVGKGTDNSGMGGAAFASLQLQEEEREKNKGAVQEPNPFLKRHLLEATYDLFKILKEKNLLSKIGLKDLGAGGVMCASIEMAYASGYGATIDLEKIHVSMSDLHPAIIACGETQERLCWVCHPSLTSMILDHYNKKWALPEIAKHAAASSIGKITKGNYVLRYKGAVVCDAKPRDICEGLMLNRPLRPRRPAGREPKLSLPRDIGQILLQILAHENVACRKSVYESYDKNVQGLSVVEAGEADAGVLAPLRNRLDVPEESKQIGIALSTDGNPRYGLIDPYWQAANAAVEGMRNVAAVGATPLCVTDCLNYGNPEKPDQMWELAAGVSGLSDALTGVGMKNNPKTPIPCISGNVSLYNYSPKGSIAPQAIVATLGRIENISKVVTPELKEKGNFLFLIGPRKNELGGSVYYNLFWQLGVNLPKPNFEKVRKELALLLDLIDAELVQACHDISDGGLGVTVSEMCMIGRDGNNLGAKINLKFVDAALYQSNKKGVSPRILRSDQKLFSETGGFVLEIRKRDIKKAKKLAAMCGVPLIQFGRATETPKLSVFDDGKELLSLKLSDLRNAWGNGLREKMK